MSDKNMVSFVDNIGRTLVGEELSSKGQTLKVKNPAILHVQPNQQTGQISVQLVPFFFKEFQKGGGDTVWNFNKSNVTLASEMELDERLLTQYHNMFSAIQTPDTPQLVGAGAGTGEPPVVKLFDD
jgi:hypothetical protein